MANPSRSSPGHRDADSKLAVVEVLQTSVYTTALAAVALTQTKPVSDLATGRGVRSAEDYTVGRVFFAGKAAENKTINYQVILWRRMKSAPGGNRDVWWMPQIVARGVATLGATAAPTWLIAADGFMADTVAAASINQGGNTLVSPSNDGIGHIEVPLKGADLIEVQCDLGDATEADALIQLGE